MIPKSDNYIPVKYTAFQYGGEDWSLEYLYSQHGLERIEQDYGYAQEGILQSIIQFLLKHMGKIILAFAGLAAMVIGINKLSSGGGKVALSSNETKKSNDFIREVDTLDVVDSNSEEVKEAIVNHQPIIDAFKDKNKANADHDPGANHIKQNTEDRAAREKAEKTKNEKELRQALNAAMHYKGIRGMVRYETGSSYALLINLNGYCLQNIVKTLYAHDELLIKIYDKALKLVDELAAAMNKHKVPNKDDVAFRTERWHNFDPTTYNPLDDSVVIGRIFNELSLDIYDKNIRFLAYPFFPAVLNDDIHKLGGLERPAWNFNNGEHGQHGLAANTVSVWWTGSVEVDKSPGKEKYPPNKWKSEHRYTDKSKPTIFNTNALTSFVNKTSEANGHLYSNKNNAVVDKAKHFREKVDRLHNTYEGVNADNNYTIIKMMQAGIDCAAASKMSLLSLYRDCITLDNKVRAYLDCFKED